MPRFAKSTLLLLGFLVTGFAWGRTSDRKQPMDIESGHQSGTLQGDSVSVLSNGVEINQGSLHITSSRAEITMHDGEISRAVFAGSPVVLTQQMDDGTPMKSRASNVDYNLQNEVVVFTGDVQLEQPRGSMSGQRVVYNLKTGAIDSGGESGGGRVHMRILPKGASSTPASPAPAATTPAAPAPTTPATEPTPAKTTP
jgi:lipopolysaccharide export system protein LptA